MVVGFKHMKSSKMYLHKPRDHVKRIFGTFILFAADVKKSINPVEFNWNIEHNVRNVDISSY